jgi:glycosyltransferase involved in cell wall biosynthesis
VLTREAANTIISADELDGLAVYRSAGIEESTTSRWYSHSAAMRTPRILILIVSYHAERFIQAVLDRIPEEIWRSDRFETEILILDDESKDETFSRAVDYARHNKKTNIKVLYNPRNQGYGGNQKIGYRYAIDQGFDAVVLLHGDGQYAPEHLGSMLGPLVKGEAEVVLGSRMINRSDALRGRMPLYKWVGNQILTLCQNWILGSSLSEFHTGYRAYSVRALASIPFERNSNYFDFDTDILIQLLDTGKRITEIPVPTFYGDELSRVNGIKYAALILRSSILSRIMKLGIFYDPKFDYAVANTHYTLKLGYPSSHQFALDRVRGGSTVLDIGCGPGFMARELSKKQARTISLDRYIAPATRQYSFKTIETDVEEFQFSEATRVDTVLLLDVIEHLVSPERFLERLRNRYCADAPEVVITTGNIAFLPIRLALLLGQFNYGKRGILDLTHTRLFTFSSLRRLLAQSGYDIVAQAGLPAPFLLAFGDTWFSRVLMRLNILLIKISKGLFSYQIAMVVSVRPTLNLLLHHAQNAGAERLGRHDAAV